MQVRHQDVDTEHNAGTHIPRALCSSCVVCGMPLTSFMNRVLGMTNPMLSSLSRAIWSRQAKSPAANSDEWQAVLKPACSVKLLLQYSVDSLQNSLKS